MDQLVSVLIPAYNASSTIVETLESVRAQIYPHFEIIVIDDGSTDDTAAIVESFARGDRRIRLVRKPNGGLPSARNAGIAVARGAFEVDADDLWQPDKLAAEVAAMRRLGASVGMVYCWGWRIDERSRLLPGGFICHAYEGEAYAALILQNFVVSPVYRAEAIRASAATTRASATAARTSIATCAFRSGSISLTSLGSSTGIARRGKPCRASSTGCGERSSP